MRINSLFYSSQFLKYSGPAFPCRQRAGVGGEEEGKGGVGGGGGGGVYVTLQTGGLKPESLPAAGQESLSRRKTASSTGHFREWNPQ